MDAHKPDLLELLDRWPELNRLAAIGMAHQHFQARGVLYVTVEAVETPEPGRSYDFADPMTGAYGQCWRSAPEGWDQAPQGRAPVLLSVGRVDLPEFDEDWDETTEETSEEADDGRCRP